MAAVTGRGSFAGFLAGLVTGAVALVALLSGLVLALERFAPEHLPPPAISNRIDLDEKLRYLREHPTMRPEVLAVGSSITLQHFDGSAFGSPSRVYNGASWGLHLTQTRFLLSWYLDRFPSVRTVVILTGLTDARSCDPAEERLFDVRDASRYVDGRIHPLWLYGKYFDPAAMAVRIATIAHARTAPELLARDVFGSQPRDPSLPAGEYDLFYGVIEADPRCAAALSAIGAMIERRSLRALVAVTPVHPAYARDVPGADRFLADYARMVRTALAPYRGVRVVVIGGSDGPDADEFIDAFHFRWSVAQGLSRRIATQLPHLRPGTGTGG